MRQGLILLLFMAISCSSKQPVRSIASEYVEIFSEVDITKSSIQVFPGVSGEENLWYHFYLQLKNSNGEYVDCDPADIILETNRRIKIPYKYDRTLAGRYYLSTPKTDAISSSELNIFIQNKPLKKRLKLHSRYPDKNKSSIKILRDDNNSITFGLSLVDRMNLPIEVPNPPEIIVEGSGDIEDLKQIDEGRWEFTVIYPAENQILYFSVRAQGVYLPRLFRYQHVEK